MTYPNPAGYYGLQLPESVETEITDLDYVQTCEMANDLAYSLAPYGDDFNCDHLSDVADLYIQRLPIEQQIALLRWIAERLAFLAR